MPLSGASARPSTGASRLLLRAAIKATHLSAEDYHRDVEHAQTSLRAAQVAVEAMGRPVKTETEVLRGQPAAILVSESEDTEMICVGSVGIGRYARALLGSTATEVAGNAHCPVAVIRSQPDEPRQNINWIVVAVGDAPNRDIVVDQAMREAQLHKLPVLAVRPHAEGLWVVKLPRGSLDGPALASSQRKSDTAQSEPRQLRHFATTPLRQLRS
jgi:nucleotide-binding universal stress UspA family protein